MNWSGPASGAQGHGYEWRDTGTSLAIGLGSTVAGAATGGLTAAMLAWAHALRPLSIGWAWWAWPLCFVLDDLAYYCVSPQRPPRALVLGEPREPPFQPALQSLDRAAAELDRALSPCPSFSACRWLLIGFEPGMILACAGLNLIYQFWIHTEAMKRLPRWFEAVMNTPSHHRVHHAINARYLDRNYAGDIHRLGQDVRHFRSRRTTRSRIRYGIVSQLGSFNLLYAVFHEWIGIARDVWQRAVAAQAVLPLARTRLEPRWQPRNLGHDPPTLATITGRPDDK